jgi:hypothetical protein
MGVFTIRSVYDTKKPLANRRGPQFDEHCDTSYWPSQGCSVSKAAGNGRDDRGPVPGRWSHGVQTNCDLLHNWWSRWSLSSCRWGETTSLNCNHQPSHCSFPRWYMSREKHGGIMMSRKVMTRLSELSGNPTSSHLATSRRDGRKAWEFGLAVFLSTLANEFLHAVKSYMGGLRPFFPS